MGTSKEEVKTIVNQKGNYTITDDSPDGIAYTGKFAGNDAVIVLYFFEDKFYRGVVDYPYEQNQAISKYKSVKEQLSSKYGKPKEEKEFFLKPYYKGDGYEEQAIRVNKGVYMSTWTFTDNNSITVFIPKTLDTLLFYENTELKEAAEKKESEKNMSDF